MLLTTNDTDFLLDGQPFRVLSGALHYFRVPREYWRDRLVKLKACGLNTVETYVPWNLHEPRPGEFDFAGMLDLEGFVRLAGELGLLVIVRPGPYICSEWDLGGLPSWLLADSVMQLRCAHPAYLAACDRFFGELLPRLVPLQCTHGGPLVAMQVENEYGSYGNDKVYLAHLEACMRALGVDVLLFTSDGPCDWMLAGGTLSHLLKVANFGSGATGAFAKLREWQPAGPLMCGEYWNGWFDHFGETHHTRSAEDAARALDEILSLGGSVNLYMFHGGTNFGWMGGANGSVGKYEPDVSSYDYDSPLDEAGRPTPKFFAFRDVLGKYVELPPLELPEPLPQANWGRVELTQRAGLWDNLERLASPLASPTPRPMELLGQSYGFTLYRTAVSGPREECQLHLQEVHDRAQVFVDGEFRGVIDRDNTEPPVKLAFGPGEHTLELLVEGMGRINYGPLLFDRKGITHGVRLAGQFLFGWTHYCLELADLTPLAWQPHTGAPDGPAFYRGTFAVDSPADGYLALPGWRKGVCFVNGHHLGRYWDRGPQRTFYVPAPFLRVGENELVVFELHGAEAAAVEFRDEAEL